MNSVITKHVYILDLLEDIIQEGPEVQTELMICTSKGDFVNQVLAELHQYHVEQESASLSEEAGIDEQDESVSTIPDHNLLSRTLHILSASQNVKLVFFPTITVLRGYLSGFVPDPIATISSLGPIIMLNLLAMHHGTSEFTLQGLSQTFATIVSAAHRTGRALRLVECKDIHDPSNPNRGSALWQAEVQLLSAAIKIGEAGQNWGRRTIPVMKIASRWFNFEETKAAQHGEREGATGEMRPSEEEMLV